MAFPRLSVSSEDEREGRDGAGGERVDENEEGQRCLKKTAPPQLRQLGGRSRS